MKFLKKKIEIKIFNFFRDNNQEFILFFHLGFKNLGKIPIMYRKQFLLKDYIEEQGSSSGFRSF